jgi:hypothetical protein
MDNEQILKRLRAACEKAGSQRAWALAHGIAPQYPNLVLTGRRPPGPQILRALGLKREVRVIKAAAEE